MKLGPDDCSNVLDVMSIIISINSIFRRLRKDNDVDAFGRNTGIASLVILFFQIFTKNKIVQYILTFLNVILSLLSMKFYSDRSEEELFNIELISLGLIIFVSTIGC